MTHFPALGPYSETLKAKCENGFKSLCPSACTFNFRLVIFYVVSLSPFPRPVVCQNSVYLVLLVSTKEKQQSLTLHFSQCSLILIDSAEQHLLNIYFPSLFLPGVLN